MEHLEYAEAELARHMNLDTVETSPEEKNALKRVCSGSFFVVEDNLVAFRIQEGTQSEASKVNGVQAEHILRFVKDLFVSLNKAAPCRQNSLTITKLEEALHWQKDRTNDRIRRDVEGTYGV